MCLCVIAVHIWQVGADMSFSCMQSGKTALDCAIVSGSEECKRFLQMHSTAYQIADEAENVSVYNFYIHNHNHNHF